MNRENEKRLTEFPFGIARNMYDGEVIIDEDGTPMGFPCECSDGWADLIYNLCKELNDLYISKGWSPEEIQILQIKEKFGTLRFYDSGLGIEGNEIVYKYENLSSGTCEICGASGEIRDGRWIMTMCDKCFKENEE